MGKNIAGNEDRASETTRNPLATPRRILHPQIRWKIPPKRRDFSKKNPIPMPEDC
jgi:hypothetical protein